MVLGRMCEFTKNKEEKPLSKFSPGTPVSKEKV
jgi:hypothetical protein